MSNTQFAAQYARTLMLFGMPKDEALSQVIEMFSLTDAQANNCLMLIDSTI